MGSGIPFLPQVPTWHPIADLNAHLRCFELSALDVVDVVVSKLRRFSAADRRDIAAMVELDRVPHATLIARFRAAVDYLLGDAREQDLPKTIANLHVVERDFLGVAETEIELPGWI